MNDVIVLFLFLAGIVLAGFLGTLFFKRTKFSDFILLMLLGLFIGPVFNLLGTDAVVFLRSITPFFAAFALAILLFEGGLRLNFYHVLKELPRTALFTLLVFVVSVVLIATILLLFGWNFLVALMVGAILGGTSSAIIVPMIQKASVSEETKTLLTLESSITDALCVIVTIALAQIILSQNIQFQVVLQGLVMAFSIAAVIGAIVGLFWIKLLRDESETKKYQYILSLAMLFLVYAITEYVGGNGAFSALVFGLVLGNAKEITKMLRMRSYAVALGITQFQSEISLFVRTFFFVYLGIIFVLTGFDWMILVIAVFVTFGILFARMLSVQALLRYAKNLVKDQKAIFSAMPRGLAAAVLATYPLTIGLTRGINVEQIVQLSFLVILFSNVAASLGIFHFEKEAKRLEEQKKVDKKIRAYSKRMDEMKI